jgi:hypothetical protein
MRDGSNQPSGYSPGPAHSSFSGMLKKSVSGVLASLRGSTYRSVRLASSLAAALLNSLFEHPAKLCHIVPDRHTIGLPHD